MCLLNLFILSVLSASPVLDDKMSMGAIFKELDCTIKERQLYQEYKENRIASLKRESDNGADFDVCNRIFDEYRYFQYDSAYVYARKLEKLAALSGDADELSVASSALLACYKSVGFFKEATDVIRNYRPEGVSDGELVKFYILCASTYQNLSSYVSGSEDLSGEYDRLKLEYYRKALMYSDVRSYEYAWITLEKNLIENYSDSLSIDGRKALLARFNMGEHELAVQYSILASCYQSLGMTDEALCYRALSAIYDIRSCTRETTSAKVLAEIMFHKDDISRAYRYIQQALYDAQYYNSRLRMVEINAILPGIERKRSIWFNHQILILSVAVLTVLILLAVTFVLLRKLKRKNTAINEAQKKIIYDSDLLKRSNDALTSLNEKLQETNEIKDQYIIQTLYGNTDFVNDIEQETLAAIRKIAARQYDDARGILHNLPIKEEREKLYASFDAAFLKLFPNFIEEFNRLFPEGKGINLEDNGNLPMEVRIFALMRLGIDNTAKVAEYLNLSVNTVYVYKTRLKSRSYVGREEFDDRIMAIPKL